MLHHVFIAFCYEKVDFGFSICSIRISFPIETDSGFAGAGATVKRKFIFIVRKPSGCILWYVHFEVYIGSDLYIKIAFTIIGVVLQFNRGGRKG